VIDGLEAGFLAHLQIIDAADVHEHFEGKGGIILQELQDLAQLFFADDDGQVVPVVMVRKDL
jgi:hypothetical protein